MNMYLGITDFNWFSYLRSRKPDEVNFWQPSGTVSFKALQELEPFLFKLKKPHNAIGGVGFFYAHDFLPLSMAWRFFGEKNGCASYPQFVQGIRHYRHKSRKPEMRDPVIGCITLTDPVFFEEKDWIPAPGSWAGIVQGKRIETTTMDGLRLWRQVQDRLEKYQFFAHESKDYLPQTNETLIAEPQAVYRTAIQSKIRIGQGAFRSKITKTYTRKCAITGEKTLPVLEAAHVKPYAESGPNHVANGLLLRSDFHTLYDAGYLTINQDYRVEVSQRIREEFQNGKEYYKYNGAQIWLPSQKQDRPAKQFIDWHNEHRYLG